MTAGVRVGQVCALAQAPTHRDAKDDAERLARVDAAADRQAIARAAERATRST